MLIHHTKEQGIVLDMLDDVEFMTFDQVCAKWPELSWSDVFLAVDELSRRGEVILQRRGNEYAVRRKETLVSAAEGMTGHHRPSGSGGSSR